MAAKSGKIIIFLMAILAVSSLIYWRRLHLVKKESKPLTVIFENLDYDHNWDITNGFSLAHVFILNNIVETLIRVDNNSALSPALAKGWVLTDDQKTVKLSLSNKYQFHSGSPITPEDILLSLKRSLSTPQMRHSEIRKSLVSDDLEKSITLEGNSVNIHLKEPLNALLYKLSISEMGIAPKDYIQGKEAKKSLSNLSGPYQAISFTKKELQLKKHSHHPLVHESSPDRVNIIEITDGEDAIEYYKNNNNVIIIGSGYQEALRYAHLEGEKYASAPNLTAFLLPNIDSEKLNTLEKRKAVFSILHRAFQEVEINSQFAERTQQIFTRNNRARLDEQTLSDFYGDEPAQKHLSKISVLMFDATKNDPIIPDLEKKLKNYGIELEIHRPGNKEALRRIDQKEYDLFFAYTGVSALDPIVELIYLFELPIINFSYKNKELVSLLDKAKIEPDRDKYTSMLQEIHLRLLKDYRILPLIHTGMLYCAKGAYQLKEMNNFDGGFNLWDWHRK